MSVVLDASAAASWVLPDEFGAEALLDADPLDFFVPAVFPSEILYLLARAERHGRIREAEVRDALSRLQALPIRVVAPDGLRLSELRDLSLRHGINAYDAAYLSLARERGLPLATLDARLASAARGLGLAAFP